MLKKRFFLALLVISFCAPLLAPQSVSAEENSLFNSHASDHSSSTSVEVGGYHSCAVLNDGVVKCWGYNDSGQVGDGTTTNRSSPVAVDLGAGMTAISVSVSGLHSCAVLNDRSVKCWGDNEYGQLGDGSTTDRTSPTAVDLGAGMTAVSVSSGDLHSCAVLNDGSVKCWGRNEYGQLGDGSTTDRTSPTAVDLGAGMTAVSVSAGFYHTCAVLNDGSLKCWGYNQVNSLGDGTTVNRTSPTAVGLGAGMTAVSVSGGGYHTCAVLNDGSVKCWGWNGYGQVGDGSSLQRSSPVAVDVGAGMTAVSVNAGAVHSCAVLNDGSVKCWGRNDYGQLGDGSTTDRPSPTAVDLGAGMTAVSVSGGYVHSCAVLNDGSVKCWGRNDFGSVGDGSTTDRTSPTAVDLGAGMTAVSVSGGLRHSCAVLNDGVVKCWGNNEYGQLGDGSTTDRSSPVAVDVGVGMTAVSVSSGAVHSCAVLNDGSVKCWGWNDYGQVGDGSTTDRSSPVAVDLGAGMTAVSVNAGGYHTCAVLNDGSVKCWGDNETGELGDGTTIDRSSPVAVDLGAGMTAVSVSGGSYHTCAVLNDGSVKCWGDNFLGQLGDGTNTNRTSPTAVDLGAGMTAVSVNAGYVHSCAVLNDGSLKCWGDNGNGQLGDGTTTDRTSPTAVDLGAGMTAVSVSGGSYHACAVLNDGSLKCWGYNSTGQVGDDSTTTRLTPTAVDLGAGKTAMSVNAGGYHTCAVLNDGSLKCWGDNNWGQVGDGSTTDRYTPTLTHQLGPPHDSFLDLVSTTVSDSEVTIDGSGVGLGADEMVVSFVPVPKTPFGDPGISNMVSPQIIGGDELNHSDAPYQVWLNVDDWSCGGVLIHEQWVLTAAHCVVNDAGCIWSAVSSSDVSVLIGANGRSYMADNGMTYSASNVYVHSSYDTCNLENDIALIELSRSVSAAVGQPIELLRDSNYPQLGDDMAISGWGAIADDGSVSPELLQAAIVTVQAGPGEECGSWGEMFIPATQICANDLGQSTCYGDSGGPWVSEVDGIPYLAGVTSYGAIGDCDSQTEPTVSTRVSAYTSWIDGYVPSNWTEMTQSVGTPLELNLLPDTSYLVDVTLQDSLGSSSVDRSLITTGNSMSGEMKAIASTRTIDVTSVNGERRVAISDSDLDGLVPDSDVEALVLNIKVFTPGQSGYLAVFNCDASNDRVSALTLRKGETTQGTVISKVSADTGEVCIEARDSSHSPITVSRLIVYTTGYVETSTQLVPIDSTRTIDVTSVNGERRVAITDSDLDGLVPDSDVGALVLNVKVFTPEKSGYLAVFNCDAGNDRVSSLTLRAGETIQGAVISKVSDDTGEVCIEARDSSHDPITVSRMIVYTTGYVQASPEISGAQAFSGTFTQSEQTKFGAPISGQSENMVRVSLVDADIDHLQAGTTGIALNVKVFSPSKNGYLAVFNCDADNDRVSSLTLRAGETIQGFVIAMVGETTSDICVEPRTSNHAGMNVARIIVYSIGQLTDSGNYTAIDSVRTIDIN